MAVDPQTRRPPAGGGRRTAVATTARIAVRRNIIICAASAYFIELCADVLDEATVKQALSPVAQE